MHKFTKILAGILILIAVIVIATSAWFLFYKKTSLPKLVSWTSPDLSALTTSNAPGQLYGPTQNTKAQVLSPDKIIEITNSYRTQNNLPPLTKNDLLTTAAQSKADDMFAKQYFEHVAPDGTTPAQRVLKTGYNYKVTGENLALGDFKDEQDLVDAWMASPGHRANILNPDYKEIGVATGLNNYQDRNTWMAVQEFGVLAPNCNNPSQTTSNSIDNKKAEYKSLSDQMQTLASDAQSLADQANQQMTQGNTIYSQTHSKSKAQPYWDEAQALRTESQQKLKEAQAIDSQLKDLFNQINNLVNDYNAQINTYNKCIKS